MAKYNLSEDAQHCASFFVSLGMNDLEVGEFPRQLEQALLNFMDFYVPADQRDFKVSMTTFGVAKEISDASGIKFSVDDAYNFLVKAGYSYDRYYERHADIFWRFKQPGYVPKSRDR